MSHPESEGAPAGFAQRLLARFLDLGFAALALFLGVPVVAVVWLYWLYETLLTARTGRTVGKRLTAIRVVGAEGTPVGLRQSATRALPLLLVPLPFVSFLVPLVYGWLILDPARRGLHDRLAGTRVVGERWIIGDTTN